MQIVRHLHQVDLQCWCVFNHDRVYHFDENARITLRANSESSDNTTKRTDYTGLVHVSFNGTYFPLRVLFIKRSFLHSALGERPWRVWDGLNHSGERVTSDHVLQLVGPILIEVSTCLKTAQT